MSTVFLSSVFVIGGLMLFVWLLSILLRDVSIVDVAWGIGFLLVGWTAFALTPDESLPVAPSRWLLPVLVSLWGLRLSGYLLWRNWRQPEDKRYAAMRARYSPGFWWKSVVIVFGLQGVVMWIVSLPVQVGIVQAQSGWSWFHFAGVAAWLVGICFETIGDWQLAQFKSRPDSRGCVMNHGLWRYTRHPNYFGDFCVWWGLFLITIAHGVGLWTVVGPILMSLLLMRYSGVGLLEKSLVRDKPGYEEYVRSTSPFFPWPPR